MPTATEPEVLKVLRQAKELARRYHELTGKPLGVTGEIAEYEAHQILGVELTEARNAGYDATEGGRRLQIKGRCILPGSKPGQRRLYRQAQEMGCRAASSLGRKPRSHGDLRSAARESA